MDIKIYTTPACVYCSMAKKFFQENKIKYAEIDVASDASSREEMIKKTGQMGVPVIEIDNETIIGFDKRRISQILGL